MLKRIKIGHRLILTFSAVLALLVATAWLGMNPPGFRGGSVVRDRRTVPARLAVGNKLSPLLLVARSRLSLVT
ncbi:hypothetical protein ACUHMQ_12405, partial [Chitinimonas sp. PSY-7]|uniref:hypothetical protein n=1 Tax=Chitinimonas sp. PSY-7 TaxID=3459088 RepID=UPI0040402414